MGIDGVGPKLLRSCALGIYQALHHLFTISLTHHKISVEWSIRAISPSIKLIK